MTIPELTRRESALYSFGAYEMLLSMADSKIEQSILTKMIIEFMRTYLPEYSKEEFIELYNMCYKERQVGSCRKLFENRLRGVNDE